MSGLSWERLAVAMSALPMLPVALRGLDRDERRAVLRAFARLTEVESHVLP